jgi:hypothetical protein
MGLRCCQGSEGAGRAGSLVHHKWGSGRSISRLKHAAGACEPQQRQICLWRGVPKNPSAAAARKPRQSAGVGGAICCTERQSIIGTSGRRYGLPEIRIAEQTRRDTAARLTLPAAPCAAPQRPPAPCPPPPTSARSGAQPLQSPRALRLSPQAAAAVQMRPRLVKGRFDRCSDWDPERQRPRHPH